MATLPAMAALPCCAPLGDRGAACPHQHVAVPALSPGGTLPLGHILSSCGPAISSLVICMPGIVCVGSFSICTSSLISDCSNHVPNFSIKLFIIIEFGEFF